EAFVAREGGAVIRGETGSHVPAEAAQSARDWFGRRHEGDRLRLEDRPAAVEQGFRVNEDVVGGAEESRVAGDAAQGVRAGVVHFAAHPAALALFRRRAAGLERFARQEAGV